MAIQKQSYQIVGMRQDNLVGTGASTKFAHEIMNMRLNTTGDYTTASWTTEQGTLLKNITWSDAPSDALGLLYNNHNTIIPIGQAVINDQWVIFATQSETPDVRVGYDFIFKYNYQENSDVLLGTILYAGNLNFDAQHPCETLSFYENDNIQKVYWTDGKNQPRVINITNTTYHTGLDGQFDFVQDVSLNEHVTIKKNTDGAGLFPPCTVKYAITYYKKNGQETNIVYDSPLYYPIKGQRACSPDELSGDSFEIRVTGIDDTHGFDYIRLYSIIRTTEDATPIVRIVADKELATLPVITNDQDPDYNPNTSNKYALFIDTNTTGEIVDPTIIQYVGGKEIVVQTFDQKNNTLFLGNIEIKTKSVQSALDDYNAKHPNSIVTVENFNGESGAFSISEEDLKKVGISSAKFGDNSFYKYSNQMTEGDFTDVQQNTLYPALPDKIYNTTESLNGSSDKIKIFKYGETYRFGIQFQDSKGNWSEVIHLTDTTNINHPITNTDSSVAKFATFKYNLPENVRTALVEEGFRKARIVCCYPNNADRTILTQGVICPTMTNEDFENTPDAMSSWFFRPLLEHDYIANKREEVQNRTTKFNYSDDIFTINSAEIELDESIRTLDLDHTNINIVGTVPVSSYASTYHVEAGNPSTNYHGFRADGFKKRIDVEAGNNLADIREIGSKASVWEDFAVYNWDHGEYKVWDYALYPFERKGSLNDYVGDATQRIRIRHDKNYPNKNPKYSSENSYSITKSAELQSKVYSNLSYSKTVNYLDNIYNKENISIQFFDSIEVMPVKLDDSIYYGNMNTIFPNIIYNNNGGIEFYWVDYGGESGTQKASELHNYFGTYHVFNEHARETYYKGTKRAASNSWGTDYTTWVDDYYPYDTYNTPVTSDPIPMTYNSIPHVVLKDSRLSEPLKSINYNVPSLPLVEITKNNANKFRGDVKDSIFIPCGPATKIDNQQNVILYGIEGDHYFMRYDCLKTYPRALDDTNQIVEILSYMCETRINLDGRYDKNRGLTDNTIITNTNFNLINKSYTQSNNLFNYTTLDEDASKLNKYANLITWTKDKVSGEDVDLWTNITMASTADVEGTCGSINKIINVNDTLYNFQDHGIAQIGYNEKTALSTEAGIPLEIANSGKYSGLRYISKEVGCQNKWSISSTKNGCFFIDDSRQELLALNEELTSLSTINGFDAFLIQQLPDTEHFTPWTPINPNNFVSYYDKLGNDVFFINKDYCLAWNEQSKTFTSFYSYNNVPIMANIGTHLLMWDLNSILSLDIQEQTSSKTVTTYEKQVTTTISTETHVIGDNIDKLPIFNDDTYLEAIFYHYKEGSSLNDGLTNTDPIDYNGAKVWQINNLADRDTPTIIWIQNQISNIKQGWIRFTTQNKNYSTLNYQWNANYILSLEFRKLDTNNNEVPYIIQFEVNGVHKRLQSRNGWDTVDATPSIKIRATENFTDEEFELIKNGLFLGGQNQPTFNAGNVVYSYGYYSSNGTQPWNNIADSFTYTINDTERELLCIVKLYDLNKSTSEFETLDINTADYIQYIQAQGNPFRTQDQSDSSCDFDNTLYNPNDLRYDAETVTEIITNNQVTWIPSTDTIATKQYTVKDSTSTSNIWAARELSEYSSFFDNIKPYWITIVCDGILSNGNAFPADKVFNNIEYRADIYDKDVTQDIVHNHGKYQNPIFNLKAAWNGYQKYKEFPIDDIRKFNIWRVQLPRASYDINGVLTTTRDRIRNTFCYIKLLHNQLNEIQSNRFILHDLAVYFDMR